MMKETAPGKMILLGEYAVLEGAPAIVSAVNRFAVVTIEETSKERSVIHAPNLDTPAVRFSLEGDKFLFHSTVSPQQQNDFRFVKSAFEVILEQIDLTQAPSVEITIDTSHFYHSNGKKYGFGSSTALTVALLKAVFRSSTSDIPGNEAFFKLALAAHRTAQGKRGSGIDVAASVYGGTIRYIRDEEQPPVSLLLPEDLHILPVWTGKSASTSAILKELERKKENDPQGYEELIDDMGATSAAGCASLEAEKTDAFLQRISEYYNLMENLGDFAGISVISSEHRQIHTIAQNIGAAYKPSGAGSGDIGIVFSDSPDVIAAAADTLSEQDFTPIPCKIVNVGKE